MLTDRQLLILDEIIRDYTTIGEPIGSKKLQHQLPVHVSSATIRNEMALLEKEGYLLKQHSSSGRIPSLKGYQYYIDHLVKPDTLDKQSLKKIRLSLSTDFKKIDELIATSSQLLSDLTNYTVLSLKPELTDLKLEGFRIVPLSNHQVTLILVMSDGSVESQIYTLPPGMTGKDLEPVIKVTDEHLVGLKIKEIPQALHQLLPALTRYLQQPEGLVKVFGNALAHISEEHIFVSGKNHLLNLATNDNMDQLKKLYSLVEDNHNLSSILPEDNTDICVKFNSDNQQKLDYSLISATYEVESYGKGMIAILGPTNMPYSKLIGLLTAFRQELTTKVLDYYQHFEE